MQPLLRSAQLNRSMALTTDCNSRWIFALSTISSTQCSQLPLASRKLYGTREPKMRLMGCRKPSFWFTLCRSSLKELHHSMLCSSRRQSARQGVQGLLLKLELELELESRVTVAKWGRPCCSRVLASMSRALDVCVSSWSCKPIRSSISCSMCRCRISIRQPVSSSIVLVLAVGVVAVVSLFSVFCFACCLLCFFFLPMSIREFASMYCSQSS